CARSTTGLRLRAAAADDHARAAASTRSDSAAAGCASGASAEADFEDLELPVAPEHRADRSGIRGVGALHGLVDVGERHPAAEAIAAVIRARDAVLAHRVPAA